MNDDRLFELLEAYVEGRLGPGDQSALEEFLTAIPEARVRFWDYLNQHALLRQLALDAEGKELAKRFPAPKRRIWIAAAAAALVIGAGVYFWPASRTETPAVAIMDRVEGTVFRVNSAGRSVLAADDYLTADEGVETAGMARAGIRFPDGTLLDLGPETKALHIQSTGGKKVFIAHGTVRARVAQQPPGQPMRIRTPEGDATVLGTTLRINVDGNRTKGTRLEVEEGKVRLTTQAGKSLVIETGHFAVAAPDFEFVSRPLPSKPSPKALALVQAMAPNSWLSVPDSRMRRALPDPAQYPKIQADSGAAQVVSCWSGGALDTRRRQLLLWGGGPSMYRGNELYAFSLDSLSWSRLTDPTPDPSNGGQTNADGTPNSRATYNGLAYIAHADRLFALGGDPASAKRDVGGPADILWTFDLAAMAWSSRAPSGPKPPTYLGNNCSYDPETRKVWWGEANLNAAGLYSYDFDTNAWTRHTSGDHFHYQTSAVDTRRRLMVNVGEGKVFAYDLRQANPQRQVWTTSGGEALISAGNPGLDYDPVADRIVGWAGGAVYALDPETKVWTAVAAAGAPAPTSTGIYGRWRYVPGLDVFVVVTSVDENVHFFKFAKP